MGKKNYIKPEIKVVFLNDEVILASGSVTPPPLPGDCSSEPIVCSDDSSSCHTV